MSVTVDQKIAQHEAAIVRLREKSRALENGQKIILGSMLINAARRDPDTRAWLLQEAARSLTREVDRKRLAPLLDELEHLTP